MTLRRALVISLFFACFFVSFFVAKNTYALTACSCSCVDAETTERMLTTPPSSSQTYFQKCQADNVCGTRTLVKAYDITVTVSGAQQHRTACECATPQISTTFVRQSPGDTSCTATCESSCRGQGFAVNPAVQPTVVTTPCITDADCKTGVFQKYQGVTCKATTNPTTGVITGACDIPLTGEEGKANANIECANYGGAGMTGATCDFMAAGDAPGSYLITRPYFQVSSNGSLAYQQRVYTGTAYPYVENLWTVLDSDGGISATTPGLCYSYGNQQADYSKMDVTKTLVSGATPSKRYVCLKRKISQCGTVNVNQTSIYPLVKNSIRYSCSPRASVPVAQQTTSCLSPSGTYTSDSGRSVNGVDLCATPNQLCCALHCTLDAECGAYKVCTDGQCVPKTECNPNNSTWTCRTPSSAEKSDPTTCLQTLTRPLCQSAGQSCCAPPDPAAVGNCATDMRNDQNFRSRFGADGWRNFACLSMDELSSANQTMISDWKSGGSCVMGDVISSVGESKAVSRCGLQKRCCVVSAVAPAKQAQLDARPVAGSSVQCSTNLSFPARCMNLETLLEADVQFAGFDSVYNYANAVAGSGACALTPVTQGNLSSSMECAYSTCCYQGLRTCDPDTAGSCSTGEACHPQLKVCVPNSLLGRGQNSYSCAQRASAEGDQTYNSISSANGISMEEYSCQIVKSSDSVVGSKCLTKGCTVPDGQSLTSEQEYRCCVPGTGQSPSASAVTTGLNSTGGTPVEKSPSTIGLSSCVSSGQCGLDDILVTAANFANFLFRISGAIFLGIFVYAGFLFLTAGSSDRAKKGITMIKQSSIGLVLLFSAYILINFIQSSFISTANNSAVPDKCGTTSDTQNMQCVLLPVSADDATGLKDAIDQKQCVRQMCNGPANRACCPSTVVNTSL